MSFEFWFLFPISIAIATVAMASGIGGAVFFSPIFLLWLQLEPSVAIGTALLTELFGFSSGMVAYVRSRRVDYALAGNLLLFSVPGAVVGVLLAEQVPPIALRAIFASGLVFLGFQIFTSWRQEEKEEINQELAEELGPHESRIVDRTSRTFVYTIRRRALGRVFAAVGGMFLGMISVGLAELEEYELVARCRVPSPVAVATSIFIVVVTVLVAVIGHGYALLSSTSSDDVELVLRIAMFTIPGVIIGGQIGPIVGSRLNPDVLKISIAVLFMIVGAFMMATLVGS